MATARSASAAGSPLHVVGRDQRLPAAEQHAQPDVVAFGTLRLFDHAVAHLDREPDRAHRDRVGRVGTRPVGRFDQPRRGVRQLRLIE
jgi:hypothetical protein